MKLKLHFFSGIDEKQSDSVKPRGDQVYCDLNHYELKHHNRAHVFGIKTKSELTRKKSTFEKEGSLR